MINKDANAITQHCWTVDCLTLLFQFLLETIIIPQDVGAALASMYLGFAAKATPTINAVFNEDWNYIRTCSCCRKLWKTQSQIRLTFYRWAFTRDASSDTRSASFGRGISLRSARYFTRWGSDWLMHHFAVNGGSKARRHGTKLFGATKTEHFGIAAITRHDSRKADPWHKLHGLYKQRFAKIYSVLPEALNFGSYSNWNVRKLISNRDQYKLFCNPCQHSILARGFVS